MNENSANTSIKKPDNPSVTVVVPLKYHLGFAIECVESYTKKQTYPRERLSVIVVSDGTEPQLEKEVGALLSSNDRLVLDGSSSWYGNLNDGAQLADSDILFFTEAHAHGVPECIEEMVRFLKTTDYEGASVGFLGATDVFFETILDSIYDEDDSVTLTDPKSYRKLALRGFAMWRTAYLEHGPFEEDYGVFSERALSIRFHTEGIKLGFAADARVKHHNCPNLNILQVMVQSYTAGECLYRQRHSAEHCEAYLGSLAVWSKRVEHRRDLSKARLQALIGHLRLSAKDPAQWPYAARRIVDLIDRKLCAIFGIDWPIAKSNLRMQLEKLKIAFAMKLHRKQCHQLVRDYWYEFLAPFTWLRSLKRYPATMEVDQAPQNFVGADSGTIDLSSCQDTVAIGFHGVENNRQESFRWSHTEALVRASLPKGNYTVEIQTIPDLVDLRELNVSACFDDKPLAPLTVPDRKTLRFEIKESDFSTQLDHLFAFACRPTSFYNDPRRLGLPVTTITFRGKESASDNLESALAVSQLA